MSLRLRFVLLAVVLLAVSLGLVGLAIDSAFKSSSEAGLQARMESLVYLVLAATEVGEDGVLLVEDDPGDPRLQQPGSGIFARLSSEAGDWVSPSSVTAELPAARHVGAGESVFLTPGAQGYYTLRYGVRFEWADGRSVPATVSIDVSEDELQPSLQAFRSGLWRSLGTAGLILVLAQLAMITLGLGPLRRMTKDISVVESGKAERLEAAYPRELEPLKRNLNRLLDTEKANQARYRNALDSLAHGLKTPLSVVRSSLPADTPARSGAIAAAVSDMQHMITTRLQRAAASTRRSMSRAVDVGQQVERVAASLRRVHSHELISMDVTIDPGLAFHGEPRDLMEVAGNLLDNACKYGGGRVMLAATPLDPEDPRAGIRLMVEDDGPGIEPDRRESLLKRGVRGDERVEGHGLGLAIVLEIVSAYNGEIDIQQGAPGGARITVVLRTA